MILYEQSFPIDRFFTQINLLILYFNFQSKTINFDEVYLAFTSIFPNMYERKFSYKISINKSKSGAILIFLVNVGNDYSYNFREKN